MEGIKKQKAPGRPMEAKVAVLLLTCGRPEMTKETWGKNLSCAGHPYTLFWFDNGSSEEDFHDILSLTIGLDIQWFFYNKNNSGIAIALNRMMEAAFRRGFDMVFTMANDIIEPDNWLYDRVNAAIAIPNTGVVAAPLQGSAMHHDKEEDGIMINEGGQVIGNWLITKQAYTTVGLFCTDYGTYGPIDLDYCDRMQEAGLRHYYIKNRANHLGTADHNPREYQERKKQSLSASWQTYTNNQQQYRMKKRLYQFDLGVGAPA